MTKKIFFPDVFLNILSENDFSSLNEISSKMKCSITTSERCLESLIEECFVIRKFQWGRWLYRKLTKKEQNQKKWRKTHPEHQRRANREYQRKIRKEQPDLANSRRREWARKNPEKIKKSCKKWYEKNKEEYNRRRRESPKTNITRAEPVNQCPRCGSLKTYKHGFYMIKGTLIRKHICSECGEKFKGSESTEPC